MRQATLPYIESSSRHGGRLATQGRTLTCPETLRPLEMVRVSARSRLETPDPPVPTPKANTEYISCMNSTFTTISRGRVYCSLLMPSNMFIMWRNTKDVEVPRRLLLTPVFLRRGPTVGKWHCFLPSCWPLLRLLLSRLHGEAILDHLIIYPTWHLGMAAAVDFSTQPG